MPIFAGTLNEWNAFFLEQPTQIGLFLQSWEWSEFQSAAGKSVYRFADDEGTVRALIIEHALPLRCTYWYVPRGPVLKHQIAGSKYQLNSKLHIHSTFQKFLEEVCRAAKDAGATFLRLEPPVQEVAQFLAAHYALRTMHPIQPHSTLVIDLSKSDAELLATMHQKHRYNIRLAQRQGVVVEKGQGTKDNGQIGVFLKLLRETALRDRFRAHPDEYYKKMLEKIPSSHLFVATKDTAALAAHLCIGFGDTLTYLHGASANSPRNLMAPHLLHFETMRFARAQGYRYYDLWGIDEKKWPALTRFKRGFGGSEIQYPGAFDLPISPFKYRLYRMARTTLFRR